MNGVHKILDDADLALINCVKMTPSLYNPSNAGFRSTTCKKQEWECIAERLGLTAADAKRRWTCLRDRYSRDLRQVRLNPVKHESSKSDFFRVMSFLREFIRERKERRRITRFEYDGCWDAQTQNSVITGCNKTEEEDDDGEANYVEEVENFDDKANIPLNEISTYSECPDEPAQTYEEFVESQTPICHKTQRTLRPQHIAQDPLAKRVMVNNETEDDFFCKSIAAYLKQLSRTHKIKAKVEMFQILEKYIEIEEKLAQQQ